MFLMKVLILGYYGRQNLGDDAFKEIFKSFFIKHFPHVKLLIKNTDDIVRIPQSTQAIIVGGGDLMNEYFMTKIKSLLLTKTISTPVYAFGIGFPYPQLINKYIDNFDYIIHRNFSLKNELKAQNIKLFPDLAYLLPKLENFGNSHYPYKFPWTNPSSKKIGVFLSRTIYRQGDEISYNRVVDGIINLIEKIASLQEHSLRFPETFTECFALQRSAKLEDQNMRFICFV